MNKQAHQLYYQQAQTTQQQAQTLLFHPPFAPQPQTSQTHNSSFLNQFETNLRAASSNSSETQSSLNTQSTRDTAIGVCNNQMMTNNSLSSNQQHNLQQHNQQLNLQQHNQQLNLQQHNQQLNLQHNQLQQHNQQQHNNLMISNNSLNINQINQLQNSNHSSLIACGSNFVQN